MRRVVVPMLAMLCVTLFAAPAAAQNATPEPSAPSASVEPSTEAAEPAARNPTPEATESSTIVAAAGGEPLVTVGPMDCDHETAPVTLDNTAVGTATTFFMVLEPTTWWSNVEVEPSGSKVVSVPIAADHPVRLIVSSEDGTTRYNDPVPFTCEDPPGVRDPQASISDIDCNRLAVRVHLDNSKSTGFFRFSVAHGDVENYVEQGDPTTTVVRLEPGERRTLWIPVPQGDVYDSWIIGVGWAGSDWVDGSLAERSWPARGSTSYAPIDTGCSEPEPSASVAGEVLAQTGTRPAGWALGLGLLVVGTVLIAAARLRSWT